MMHSAFSNDSRVAGAASSQGSAFKKGAPQIDSEKLATEPKAP